MHTLYLLLGGNVGDRLYYLSNAKAEIEKHIGKCVNQSSIYESTPWGFEHESLFFNQLVVVKTLLSPHQVMAAILIIEGQLGRVRVGTQYQERTIDIDILFYDGLILKSNNLEIPHPRIAERKFVLAPLSEVVPDFIHPVSHKTMRQLLMQCNDQLSISIYPIPLQNAL